MCSYDPLLKIARRAVRRGAAPIFISRRGPQAQGKLVANWYTSPAPGWSARFCQFPISPDHRCPEPGEEPGDCLSWPARPGKSRLGACDRAGPCGHAVCQRRLEQRKSDLRTIAIVRERLSSSRLQPTVAISPGIHSWAAGRLLRADARCVRFMWKRAIARSSAHYEPFVRPGSDFANGISYLCKSGLYGPLL